MPSAKSSRRRSPGEGGCWAYKTKAGERWRARGPVQLQDGTIEHVQKKGFLTKTAGLDWLGDQQSVGRKGEFVMPSKQTLGQYGRDVIDGLRIGSQTRASYLKNWRLYVEPCPVAAVPIALLTGLRLTQHYRVLEKSGRKDHREGEPLSARTVRYLHAIIHGVLGRAVTDGLLNRNPADAARPPTAREAKAPEMQCWTAAQLAAFLRWAEGKSQMAVLWHVLSMTGMRGPRRGPGAPLA
jgi:hypothetical protein